MNDLQKPFYPRPGYLVYKASRLFIRLNEARLLPQGLMIGQIPVLIALSKSGDLSQKELTRLSEVEQPTMANLLARMERDGLVKRITDPEDRRNNLVSLTPKGIAAVPHVAASLEDINNQAYTSFTEEEKATFTRLLQRLIGNLESVQGE